jgi:hypothetical protein
MWENGNEIKIVFPKQMDKLSILLGLFLFYMHFMTTLPWQNITSVRRGILDSGNPLEMLLSRRQSANNPKKYIKLIALKARKRATFLQCL